MKLIGISRSVWIAAVIVSGSLCQAAVAGQINIGPIQPPSPGFGEGAQFSMLVSDHNAPVKGAYILCWFSGRHGIRTPAWTVHTDKQGRVTFTRFIPRDWIQLDTWVDLNASCDQVAAKGLWRVRGK